MSHPDDHGVDRRTDDLLITTMRTISLKPRPIPVP
jgi:hypothetical protein